MEREILIIDDNLKLCESLARSFAKRDIKSYYATNSLDALPLFIEKGPGIVLLDIMLGPENGIDILKKILELNPNAQVIMITAYAKIESAVEAIKIGAFDYIEKPVKFEKLLQVVTNAFKLLKLDEENQQ
ncbi:MAG: response regulator, partial [Deltaproteobacteria bacterium]|nr:response regulator [Deltaproteobacteria bacterium]